MSRRRESYKPCPTALKDPYGTQQLCDDAIRRIRAEGSPHRDRLPVRSYCCPCGHWHMTSRALYVEPTGIEPLCEGETIAGAAALSNEPAMLPP